MPILCTKGERVVTILNAGRVLLDPHRDFTHQKPKSIALNAACVTYDGHKVWVWDFGQQAHGFGLMRIFVILEMKAVTFKSYILGKGSRTRIMKGENSVCPILERILGSTVRKRLECSIPRDSISGQGQTDSSLSADTGIHSFRGRAEDLL